MRVQRQLDIATRKAIEANLFKDAHSAIGNWDNYLWHRDRTQKITTLRVHSSQALSIDVFGTLKAFGNPQARDAVMNAVGAVFGLPADEPWHIELEWTDTINRLRERRRTQVDVYARASKSLMLFECKFTEPDGGSCSQTKPLGDGPNKGIIQCNGSYKAQTNPITNERSRCPLTAKGIRYWDLIPQTFKFVADQDYTRCPFRQGTFQWMRNLLVCSELARDHGMVGKVLILYADSPKLEFPQMMRTGDWDMFRSSLKVPSQLAAISYQEFLQIGQTALKGFEHEAVSWRNLTRHVLQKIDEVENRSE